MSAQCQTETAKNMTMKIYRIILAGLVMTAMLAGCKNGGSSCQSCSVYTASFAHDVVPIFKSNCALSGCHTGSAATANHLSLDSAVAYAQVTASGSYLVAGNANSSLLYSQLLAGASNHMPNNGGQLSECDIQKIYCWINQGALNN
jgi:ABC-type uncharacterized transport system auxiliary subunit